MRHHGFLHVNLNVSDLACSVRFYTQALGFTVVSESSETADLGSGDETIHQVVLTAPGTRTLLALTQAPSLPVGPRGLNHLGLVLESDTDLDALIPRVTANGGSIQKQGTRQQSGESEAFAYVRDPDGYALELSTQAILYGRFP